ncbi:MAG: ROK family protein [Bacteroidales bacterium]|nr:ROK family protein [Bacteroidales bacterium]
MATRTILHNTPSHPGRKVLLDVGGTFVKCSDGRQISINSDGAREEIADALCDAVGDADEVAVAIPGPFDYANGVFMMKHKFASVYGDRFADLVSASAVSGAVQDRHPRFLFMHDVVAMLMGEVAAGAGRGYGRVALVTLGTGLGFAMSINGSVLLNDMGSPAVPIWNIPCRDGILEDYVSKRGILRGFPDGITVKELADLSTHSLSEDADSCNRRPFPSPDMVRDRFAEVGTTLAKALQPILSEYRIECLLLGGQISRAYKLFGPSLEAWLASSRMLRHIGPVSDIGSATFNGLRLL